jgi:Uma2 family endonuclease
MISMAVHAAPVTADELLRLPDDGLRRELVRGELRMMTPAGWEHGCVAAAVAELLRSHARKTESGTVCGAETGFVLRTDPDTVRAPDAAFVSRARVENVGNTAKYWPGAPDLAVEIVSPDDSFHEVEEKALEWLAAGTVAVLVLDPAKRTATVYRGQGDAHIHRAQDTLDLGYAVPGFSVAVAKLFP